MSPFDNVFEQFAALLLLAAVVGAIATRLKQPLVVAFIVVGILAGPAVLGWVHSSEPLELLAEIGIALLLFVVGLKLDLHLIRTMGPVALATGLGQVLFTSVVGFFLALVLGMHWLPALYVAVALTFSSTIIIVKLLSDKREVDALHGRIALGFLIVQDLVVVLVMIGLSAFAVGGAADNLGAEMGMVAVKGALLLVFVGVLIRWVLPRVLPHLARSQELLVLAAVTFAVALAAAGEWMGFSREVGAFLAGVALASTPFREAIGSRLVSLRDFLLLFFFILLGAELDMATLGAHVGPAIVLSAFVLIGNPLIVMVIMGAMGYRRRTGFLAGLTVAQISEFSLILVALGLTLGHIDPDTVGLVTLVGLITIGLSTYMILYSHPLYERLAPWLRVFERKVPYREQGKDTTAPTDVVDVIVFGLGRYGGRLASELQARGLRVLGVDFDPQAVQEWNAQGQTARYGDAEDPEFPATLPLGSARWVVSTLPDRDVNLALLDSLRSHGFPGRLGVAAHGEAAAEALRLAGADRVFMPYRDAAERAAAELANHATPSLARP
ncbi:cation:proton antiporter [Ectothiorhodospiraceae bacterium 2226]|nr:cation:proton antiporter [Ectothiorhodospiraceae bacterium 2226]